VLSSKKELQEIKIIARKYFYKFLLLELIFEIISYLLRLLLSNRSFYHMYFYPQNIKAITKKIPVYKQAELRIVETEKLKPGSIFLIRNYFNYEDKPNWQINLVDHEEFLYIHRWHWLLVNCSENSADVKLEKNLGYSLVRSWTKEFKYSPKFFPNDAYSASERVSNIILFARNCSGNWTDIPLDIKQNIYLMACYIARNIEYYPRSLSGNHVLNNGRALLLSGLILEDKNLISIGELVIKERLMNIFDKSGFLQEGSSHYQLLVTKWLLEIRMALIEFHKTNFLDEIQYLISKSINCCKYFLLGNKENLKIPFFGDISPDCKPSWLFDILKSPLNIKKPKKGSNNGWARLYSNFNLPTKYEFHDLRSYEFLNNDDWTKIEFHNWTLFIHHENSNMKSIASHAHYDFGAFVLYYKNNEIFLDPGRYSYASEMFHDYGLSSSSHNTLTVNSFAPSLSRGDRILPLSYKRNNIKVRRISSDKGVIVEILHEGFQRLRSGIGIHKRIFELNKEEFLLKDLLEGNNNVNLEQNFFLSKGLGRQGKINFKEFFCKIKFDTNVEKNFQNMNFIEAHRSTSYLESEKCHRMFFKAKTSLPYESNLSLKVGER